MLRVFESAQRVLRVLRGVLLARVISKRDPGPSLQISRARSAAGLGGDVIWAVFSPADSAPTDGCADGSPPCGLCRSVITSGEAPSEAQSARAMRARRARLDALMTPQELRNGFRYKARRASRARICWRVHLEGVQPWTSGE